MNLQNRGFTLIELLVVISIVGILSSVVLSSLTGARQKSRDVKRISDIKQLQLALVLYFDNNLEYPDTLAGLAPTYIPTIPVDPSTNAAYMYDNYTNSGRASCVIAGDNCAYYHLGAKMELGASTNALLGDSDIDGQAGAGPDGISVAAGCGADSGATASTDLCFDVTP